MKLRVLAKQLIDEAFAPHDPRTMDRHLGMEDCVAMLAKLKPAFIHCLEYNLVFAGHVRSVGGNRPPRLHTRTKYGIRGR
jgi:hypothetical protein